jgi:NADPH-dependent curcumin reductase CurA
MKTRTILLESRPQGMPTEGNFRFTETELPPPADGEVLLKALYVSVDPYMRGRMSEAKSYVPPYELHQPIRGGVVAEVVESRHEKFPKGTAVVGDLPWQEYIVANGKGLNRVHPDLAPLGYYLGVLGMPGLTAYFGLLDVGKPQEGQTVVVSGAAGAVGSVVGQLARIKGCRAVGIAGTDEKVQYLKETLGFDAAINYKTRQTCGRPWPKPARAAWTCTSTTWAARSPTRCIRSSTTFAHRHLRADCLLQRHRAARGAAGGVAAAHQAGPRCRASS